MQWSYADSTFLPFLRRLANTLRPFFVLIRVRNPCTFLRLRVFGWNVLFILSTSYNKVNNILISIARFADSMTNKTSLLIIRNPLLIVNNQLILYINHILRHILLLPTNKTYVANNLNESIIA